MGKVIVFVLIGALILGVIARGKVRARRARKDAAAQIHQHPERREQMLDPTDDA